MTFSPITQVLTFAALVGVLWILCGPVLRKLSKPKGPPDLDAIMAADEDRAIREAYRLRRELEQTMAALSLQERRIESIQDERAERNAPESRIDVRDHVHVGVKTFTKPEDVERFFAREANATVGADFTGPPLDEPPPHVARVRKPDEIPVPIMTAEHLERQLRSVLAALQDEATLEERAAQLAHAAVLAQPANLALLLGLVELARDINETDRNAPWLTEAHQLCTDHGITQGHILDRVRALKAILAAKEKAISDALSPLDRTRWTEDHIQTYPITAALIINAALGFRGVTKS